MVVQYFVYYNPDDVVNVTSACFDRLEKLLTPEATSVNVFLKYPHRYLEREWLIWLLHSCHLSDVFITADWRSVRNRGVLLYPCANTLKAAQAVRYLQDSYNIIEMWSEFRKHMGDYAAFVLAHYAHKIKEDTFIYSKVSINNHTVVGLKDRHITFPEKAMHSVADRWDEFGATHELTFYRFSDLPKYAELFEKAVGDPHGC